MIVSDDEKSYRTGRGRRITMERNRYSRPVLSPYFCSDIHDDGHQLAHYWVRVLPVSVCVARHSLVYGRSSRGIGLEIVRQLLKSTDNVVLATCRDPDGASDLQKLAATAKGKLHVLPLDTSSMESIAAVRKPVEEILGDDGLDYLLNNAGIVCCTAHSN